jgi:ATP/maltotriose-dependent transcriptional regulator MalT/DNA-binding SARP family transcriptional activator
MKNRSPTIAKVTRPIPIGIYPRKRLFDLMDRKRKCPVIWVSGPPGCGKTTLVTSYLDDRKMSCLWYQADEGDADPATFFYYLGLAAKNASLQKRKPLPLLTPEYLPGLPTFTLRYFESLFHRFKTPSFLVFDNYQEVPAGSPFHEVIRHGFSNVPEGINVILISRSEPPPVLIHMQANNLMEMIRWQDLRLTLKESISIITLQAKHEILPEAIKHIHTATEGWVAGLMLMLKTAELEKTDPRELGKVPKERIFDYFTGEIFDKADEKSQKFLLKTALLPKMTATMAEALTGFESADRILSQLNRNHCFTERRFRSSPAYEYHPLFRDFLLSRAKETFSPETLSDLRRRAAELLEDAHETEAAIGFLRDAGDWKGMVRLILKHAPAMLAQGRNRPLGEWLSSLPKDIFESTPWLFYWMGASHFPFDLSESRCFFEQAFREFKMQDETAGVFLAWSGVVDSIVYSWQDFIKLDQWIQRLEELMRICPVFPSPEIEARVASSMISALWLRQPKHSDIDKWSERVLSIPLERGTIRSCMMSLSTLVHHHSWLGDFERMELDIEVLGQLSRNKYAPPIAMIMTKMAEGVRYMMLGLYEEGLEALSKGIEISKTAGLQIFDAFLLGIKIIIAIDANDLKLATNTLNQMAASLDNSPLYEKLFYHFLKTREALIRRDFRLATHHADIALRVNDNFAPPFNISLNRLVTAQVMHKLGKWREAEAHLAHALRIAHQINSKLLEFYVFMIRAQFAFDQGDEASGLTCLRKALSMGKKRRYLNNVIDQPTVTAKLCIRALESEIEVDYIKDIIRKRKLIPDTPPVHLDNWPWTVQIFTFGRFELVIDGEAFQSSRKAQKKPLEMLKVIISFGEGRKITRDQASDALWPEAEGDQAQRVFDITLHRLRHLLGNDKAIILLEGRLFLDLRYCWVDSMAFERLLKQTEDYDKKEDGNSIIHSLEKAVALYKGPFLGGDTDKPWAISYNERLRSKFLCAIERLGCYLQEKGELNRAADCFRRAIDVDDIVEVFYQRLMVCLKHLGRRTDALSVYRRFKRTLAAKLELEPSQQTEAIKESLFDEQAYRQSKKWSANGQERVDRHNVEMNRSNK